MNLSAGSFEARDKVQFRVRFRLQLLQSQKVRNLTLTTNLVGPVVPLSVSRLPDPDAAQEVWDRV